MIALGRLRPYRHTQWSHMGRRWVGASSICTKAEPGDLGGILIRHSLMDSCVRESTCAGVTYVYETSIPSVIGLKATGIDVLLSLD